MSKVLFILTSHNQLGDTGKETGFHFSEATKVWWPLREAGHEIDFVSPQGGECPIDSFDLDDPINRKVWEKDAFQQGVKRTKQPGEVQASDYDGIYFVGGHGTMWDLPENKEIQGLAMDIYEQGGFVGAICHGSAGIVNAKLSSGEYFVKDKKINCFTDAEEKSVELDDTVPFLLASRHERHGALLEYSDPVQAHVVVHERVLTGQNPASATPLGHAIVSYLASL